MTNQTEKIREVLYYLKAESTNGTVKITRTFLTNKFSQNLITSLVSSGLYTPGRKGVNNGGKINYTQVSDIEVEKVQKAYNETLASKAQFFSKKTTKTENQPELFSESNISSEILNELKINNKLQEANNELLREFITLWKS